MYIPIFFIRIKPKATNSTLVGRGVAAKRNDVRIYPNFLRFRKFAIMSRFDFCSVPTKLLKRWLIRFRKNLPIVDPVAPTRANTIGLREGSNASNDANIIQDGGIKRGAVLTPSSRRNIPKYE